MLNTKICQLLKIQYPIISSGMMWFSNPEFAAAASNAGILGTITAARCKSKAELIDDIRRVKALTDKPFSVNISILPEMQSMSLTSQFFEAIMEEQVPVVETAGRDPGEIFNQLHQAGVKIIHKVPASRHALHAQKSGADAVIVVGTECGGHPGMDNVGTLVLVPRAAEMLDIPVIAGGGIADGRGLAAALALGAEGICMGTRLLATEECCIHRNFKEWMLTATEKDTLLVQRSVKNQARVRPNADMFACLAREEQGGATMEDLHPYTSGTLSRQVSLEGDLEHGLVPMGQAVGLVHDIKPLAQVIADIMDQAAETLRHLQSLI